jgi:hypothetical protein
MKQLLFSVILIALTFTTVSAQESIPLKVSSLKSAFGVQGQFEGEVRVYPTWIEVHLTRTTIVVSQHCPYKGRRHLYRLSFGLASKTDKCWRKSHMSTPLVLDRIMVPGESTELGEQYFYIQTDQLTDLSGRWIVAQIEGTSPDSTSGEDKMGYFYSHSCPDLFQWY